MTTTGFVRLLHITDLHARSKPWKTDVDVKTPLAGRAFGDPRDIAFRAMLKKRHKEESWPKAILVTGDVVNMGGSDTGEYERARDFLHALREDLDISNPKRVFVVPGNHDVTWDPKLGLADTEKFRAFTEAMKDFSIPEFHGDTLMPVTISELSNISESVGIELTLLVTPTYSGIADPLGEKLLKHLAGKLPDFTPSQMKELEQTVMEAHRTLDVAALGTAQRRYLAELPQLEPNVIRIALMHHHLLPHPQIEVTTFEAVVDAGQTLQTLIEERFDLVLHGHKHLPHLAKYTNRTRRGVHVYAGPSLFEDSTGFAFIDVYGPKGPHDIRLTQCSVDYRSRTIDDQFIGEIDRDSRVLDKVFMLASEVPTEVQQKVVQPLLENITKVLGWQAGYADSSLFDCIFDQLKEDVAAIGKRRVMFKPENVDRQLSSLMNVIVQKGQPEIRMVSFDDLDYWIAADDPTTPAHEYRMALASFAGGKSRIMVISDSALREPDFKADMQFAVDQMIGDGFEVFVVPERKISGNVKKDFGIYGTTAVGLFDHLGGSSRQLELRFGEDDLKEHESYWHELLRVRDARIKQKGEIQNWLNRR